MARRPKEARNVTSALAANRAKRIYLLRSNDYSLTPDEIGKMDVYQKVLKWHDVWEVELVHAKERTTDDGRNRDQE